ncbi:hypothetical protein [Xanthomonas sp. SI]|uniref:hypothetical protein n=1 Tax=Xanthomonas sp. SI TaxID=2724123 RepID=UPI001862644E|nr:hypothetical protein [Xanthomonas sp. SI]QNH14282.1 hypothetical protein HEP75_03751 [Xanthomonas sp. SI]
MTTEPPDAVPVARLQDDAASSWPTAAEAAVADPGAADVIDPLHPGLVRTGVVLAFLIAGPPLGTVVVGFPVAIVWSGEGPSVSSLLLALMMALFSYVFGALPALLTGLLAAWFWPRLRGWRAHLRLGLAAALLSAICVGAAIALLRRPPPPANEVAIALALCALAGFVGATLVSRLLQALRGGTPVPARMPEST